MTATSPQIDASGTDAPTALTVYHEPMPMRRLSPAQIAESQGQCVLDVFEDSLLGPLGIVAHARSLSIPAHLPREQGLAVLRGLMLTRDRVPFWLADMVKHAEEHYDMHLTQSVELGGVSDRMMGEAMSISRVAPAARQAKLSADHHIAVAGAKPEKQAYALKKAAEDGMSPNATRQMTLILTDTQAALTPQAKYVPTPIVVVGGTEDADGKVRGGHRVQASREAALAFITGHLTREDIAWLSVKLDAYVRGFGAGEVWMDPDVPTSAVYAGMPGFEEEEPEAEEDLPLPERILSVMTRLHGATLAMLHAEMPMIPQKSVRERFHALAASGSIIETGYMRQFQAEGGAVDVDKEWVVAGEEADAVDADFRDAEMFAGTGAGEGEGTI